MSAPATPPRSGAGRRDAAEVIGPGAPDRRTPNTAARDASPETPAPVTGDAPAESGRRLGRRAGAPWPSPHPAAAEPSTPRRPSLADAPGPRLAPTAPSTTCRPRDPRPPGPGRFGQPTPPGHGRGQPEGRRRQDDDRRQPERRPGRTRLPGTGGRSGPAGQRHHRAGDQRPQPRVLHLRRPDARLPLDECIEPTTVRNLFVAPATIDLAGAEIELVPAFSRELKLRGRWPRSVDNFDFTVIDCPPSLGLLTVNGLAAATEVIVPIQCEYYALEGLGQLLRNVSWSRATSIPGSSSHRGPDHVRRPHQALRAGHGRSPGSLRAAGLSQYRAQDGPSLRGAVLRPADHRVRSILPGRPCLSGVGQGGEWWPVEAAWVKASAP